MGSVGRGWLIRSPRQTTYRFWLFGLCISRELLALGILSYLLDWLVGMVAGRVWDILWGVLDLLPCSIQPFLVCLLKSPGIGNENNLFLRAGFRSAFGHGSKAVFAVIPLLNRNRQAPLDLGRRHTKSSLGVLACNRDERTPPYVGLMSL